MVNGKFDPTAGLVNSGIAGTATEKDDEENKNTNADEEMRDVSKKDGGKLHVFGCIFLLCLVSWYPLLGSLDSNEIFYLATDFKKFVCVIM